MWLDSEWDHFLSIDEHRSRGTAFRFANVSALGVLDVDDAVPSEFAEVGGEGGCVEEGLRWAVLIPAQGDDYVRSGTTPSVKPAIMGAGVVKGEPIVIAATATDQNGDIVGGPIAAKGRAWWLLASAASNGAGLAATHSKPVGFDLQRFQLFGFASVLNRLDQRLVGGGLLSSEHQPSLRHLGTPFDSPCLMESILGLRLGWNVGTERDVPSGRRGLTPVHGLELRLSGAEFVEGAEDHLALGTQGVHSLQSCEISLDSPSLPIGSLARRPNPLEEISP